MLAKTELNETNLIFAIKVKVIPITTYSMNVGKFSKGELNQLDQTVTRELKRKKMLGKQVSKRYST